MKDKKFQILLVRVKPSGEKEWKLTTLGWKNRWTGKGFYPATPDQIKEWESLTGRKV